MRAEVYTQMARVEDTHWWFRARRTIIKQVLKKVALPQQANILDAGSGTGGNLAMLSEFGTVFAVEMDEHARALANARGVVVVEAGTLPDKIPFAAQQFDLAVLFDVLEHVEQDAETLVALHKRLATGGKLLLTVPAFQFLWSQHDTAHHHKRRYSLAPLITLVESAGYKVTFATYINFWLFPLIAAVRALDRISGGRLLGGKHTENTELKVPPSPINRLLEWVFASEACVIDIMRLPFGVSIVLLAQKI
jgi:SAM-dependent methyltransferase